MFYALRKNLLIIVGFAFVAILFGIVLETSNTNREVLIRASDITNPNLMTRVVSSTCDSNTGNFGFALRDKINEPVFSCDGGENLFKVPLKEYLEYSNILIPGEEIQKCIIENGKLICSGFSDSSNLNITYEKYSDKIQFFVHLSGEGEYDCKSSCVGPSGNLMLIDPSKNTIIPIINENPLLFEEIINDQEGGDETIDGGENPGEGGEENQLTFLPIPDQEIILTVEDVVGANCVKELNFNLLDYIENINGTLKINKSSGPGEIISTNYTFTNTICSENNVIVTIKINDDVYEDITTSFNISIIILNTCVHDPNTNPVIICNCVQLQNITNIGLDKNYEIGQVMSCQDSLTWNDGDGFYSIGHPGDGTFIGSFNGNNHIITNLHSKIGGLFLGNAGTISNVILQNINISLNGKETVGALAGHNSGNISNSSTSGSLRDRNGMNMGGLVGWNQGNIINSHSSVNIESTSNIGGLVGFNLHQGNITNSYATGNVLGEYTLGGLVGSTDHGGNIINSYATGSVSGSGNWIGGFIGANIHVKISNSYATGSVSGQNYVGGFVGNNYGANSIINNSYATGSVSGQNYTGGFVGQITNTGASISSSYATGSVSGQNNVGGFVGVSNFVNIIDSYSTGNVNGNTNVGGFGGSNTGTDGVGISTSYTISNVGSCISYCGGFLGITGSGTPNNNFWNEDTSDPRLNSIWATQSNTTAMQNPQTYIESGWSTSIWNLVNGQYPTHQ